MGVLDAQSIDLSAAPVVYFLQSGPAGPVKIGRTKMRLFARVEALQTGNPVRLSILASVPCWNAHTLERAFHRVLAPDHIHLEWFAWTDWTRRAVSVACMMMRGHLEQDECPLTLLVDDAMRRDGNSDCNAWCDYADALLRSKPSVRSLCEAR